MKIFIASGLRRTADSQLASQVLMNGEGFGIEGVLWLFRDLYLRYFLLGIPWGSCCAIKILDAEV